MFSQTVIRAHPAAHPRTPSCAELSSGTELPAIQSPTHILVHTLSGCLSPSRELPNFWGSEEPGGEGSWGLYELLLTRARVPYVRELYLLGTLNQVHLFQLVLTAVRMEVEGGSKSEAECFPSN